MKRLSIVLLVTGMSAAHAAPWLCTDPDGNKSFSYEPESANKKHCVDHPIPSGNVWRVRPRQEANSPTSFPRVEAKVQKQRDAARREILQLELAEEKKSLANAMKQLAEQQRMPTKEGRDVAVEDRLKPYKERVRVHLSNIQSLQKELGYEG